MRITFGCFIYIGISIVWLGAGIPNRTPKERGKNVKYHFSWFWYMIHWELSILWQIASLFALIYGTNAAFMYCHYVTCYLNSELTWYRQGKNSEISSRLTLMHGTMGKSLAVIYIGIVWLGAGNLNRNTKWVKTPICHVSWHWFMVHLGLSMAAFICRHFVTVMEFVTELISKTHICHFQILWRTFLHFV